VPFSAASQFLDGVAEGPAPVELGSLAANCLDSRKLSIYGGANEVQRNLIAKAFLAP